METCLTAQTIFIFIVFRICTFIFIVGRIHTFIFGLILALCNGKLLACLGCLIAGSKKLNDFLQVKNKIKKHLWFFFEKQGLILSDMILSDHICSYIFIYDHILSNLIAYGPFSDRRGFTIEYLNSLTCQSNEANKTQPHYYHQGWAHGSWMMGVGVSKRCKHRTPHLIDKKPCNFGQGSEISYFQDRI